MGHNVGTAADRAVKKSEQRGKIISERTPEERLTAIRRNLEAGLFNPPVEQKFLLDQHDHQIGVIADLQRKRDELQDRYDLALEQIEQFRAVYEQENRSTVVKVERVPALEPELVDHDVHRFADDGGPAGDHSSGD